MCLLFCLSTVIVSVWSQKSNTILFKTILVFLFIKDLLHDRLLFFSSFYYKLKRVIPQRTVDNNLGPDRLAGPKALDPNYCRQPTL